MTMLDDDVLVSLFTRAGASFEVPESGPAEILARAGANSLVAGTPAGEDGGDSLERFAGGRGAADAGVGEGAEPVPPAGTRPGHTRRLVATARRHRTLSVAASIVVVLAVAGTLGALAHATSSPTITSSSAKPPVPAARAHAGTSTAAPGRTPAGAAGRAASPPQRGNSSISPGAGTSPVPAPTAPTTPSTIPSLPTGAVGQPAKIEQTGTLGLTVGHHDLDPTMTRLSALAGVYGGFVANSQTQTGGGAPYGTVTLQVPVDSFSAVLKHAQSLGKTANLSTKATDVTGQYVDLNARITALQDSRQQYLTILSKATSIGDILSVQEQVDTIQSQIEQLQGQLNLLTSETSYSTLTVSVNETASPPRPVPLPESGLVQAWHDGVGGFVAGIEGVVRVAGPLLFALLLLGLALTGGRVVWRRLQRHRL